MNFLLRAQFFTKIYQKKGKKNSNYNNSNDFFMGHEEISIYAWAMQKSEFLVTSENRGFHKRYRHLSMAIAFINSYTHCSYLDIYISRIIRLCVVDLEDKFQPTGQTPQLFGLETQIYYMY